MLDQEFINQQLERKKKQKKAFDFKKSRATQKKGLLILNTGQGKGKSTAAFGMLARAAAHQMKAGVVQFVKGNMQSAERNFFTQLNYVQFHTADDGFTWLNNNLEQEVAHTKALWEISKKLLADVAYEFIILDEINIMLHYQYLSLDEVITTLQNRPPSQHVVLTGRHAPKALIEVCDLVSNIQMVKHPFHQQGIQAQAGIEF